MFDILKVVVGIMIIWFTYLLICFIGYIAKTISPKSFRTTNFFNGLYAVMICFIVAAIVGFCVVVSYVVGNYLLNKLLGI